MIACSEPVLLMVSFRLGRSLEPVPAPMRLSAMATGSLRSTGGRWKKCSCAMGSAHSLMTSNR
jgi:hypothetical protein